MKLITASLEFYEDADPPRAAVHVHVDTEEVARVEVSPTFEWLAVLDALSTAADVDMREHLAPALVAASHNVKARIAEAEELQNARRQADADIDGLLTAARL